MAAAVLVAVIGAYLVTSAFSDAGSDQPPTSTTSGPAAASVAVQPFTSKLGFTAAAPRGWKRADGGSYVQFTEPGGGRRLRFIVEPRGSGSLEDFLGAAERYQQDKQSNGAISEFDTVRMEPSTLKIDGRPTWEWEWTYAESGQARHVLWRVAQGDKNYSVSLSTPEKDFASAKPVLDQVTRSYRPAR